MNDDDAYGATAAAVTTMTTTVAAATTTTTTTTMLVFHHRQLKCSLSEGTTTEPSCYLLQKKRRRRRLRLFVLAFANRGGKCRKNHADDRNEEASFGNILFAAKFYCLVLHHSAGTVPPCFQADINADLEGIAPAPKRHHRNRKERCFTSSSPSERAVPLEGRECEKENEGGKETRRSREQHEWESTHCRVGLVVL